ncbi:MAG: hypothetical protein WBP93_22725, partial [Pyrinomonadaceae bacterium]
MVNRRTCLSTIYHLLFTIYQIMQTYINELSKHVGEEVAIKGWLYNLRSSGKLLFPQLRDGTG